MEDNKKVNEKANEVRELTEEKLAQVVGGMSTQQEMDFQIPSEDGQDEILYDISVGLCPFCKIPMKCDLNNTKTIQTNTKCPKCGFTMPDISLL